MSVVVCPGCGEENPAKFRLCGYCGVPLAAAPPPRAATEVRKTVTIVFTDLKGSTSLAERLDPEALREVISRYFETMVREIERHGGKVEKFIGDAVMAVFGLRRAHEDDALRAVRAAAGMREVLTRLNEALVRSHGIELANRTGVNTGEVIATQDANALQQLVTGDAVNVAARLEQIAGANEILLGETTYALVRDAVEVGPAERVRVAGKAAEVTAYRLLSARGIEGNLRRTDTPLVGRDAEAATILSVYQDVVTTRSPRIMTVIADAGAGKSRLVLEVAERRAAGARVLRGRCLSYGAGITFWPLRLMLTSAARILDEDAPEAAFAKLEALIGDVDIAERLAAASGLSSLAFPLQETNWAVRKWLERLAKDGPVIALVDDIHWAEKAFLDLLEHVRQTAVDTPLLILTTARHDLLDAYPRWGEAEGASRLVLSPLDDRASAELLANLLGGLRLSDDVRGRIIDAAEGNPLYVEQMLAMLIDRGILRQEDGVWVHAGRADEVPIPPTINALVEGRLEALGLAEREIVGPASVIGLVFARGALASIVHPSLEPSIDEHLTTLSSKRFIRPSGVAQTEFGHRFQHQLIRDIVYRGLLKRSRATLHVSFVRWADRINADRDRALEFEEILGYHLEQAFLYLRELGVVDADGERIARDAASRLASAGRRAFARGDMHAASKLLRRAIALLSDDDALRRRLLSELAETLMGLGNFTEANALLDAATAAAEVAGDARVKAWCGLVRMLVRLHGGEQQNDWGQAALKTAHDALLVLEETNAHDELATAWRLIVLARGIAGQYELASEAVARSNDHARAAGNEHLVARNDLILSINSLYGPRPVPEAIAECEAIIERGIRFRQVEARVTCTLALLKAMHGDIDGARVLHRRGRAMLRDLAQGVVAASTGITFARIELLGGDLATAEAEVRSDYDFLTQLGETYVRSTLAALLARVVREQGRDDEALALSLVAEQTTGADDVESQALWRSVRAPLLARTGDVEGGLALAKSALVFARQTESPGLQAEVGVELAGVLNIAGRREDARAAIVDAISLFVAKGDTVSGRRAIAWADAEKMF